MDSCPPYLRASLALTLTLTLTPGNTRKPSIAGKPRDAAVNSIVGVATTAFSYKAAPIAMRAVTAVMSARIEMFQG